MWGNSGDSQLVSMVTEWDGGGGGEIRGRLGLDMGWKKPTVHPDNNHN